MPYIVAFGSNQRSSLELGAEPAVVGRERKATLSISDFQVSRRHVELTRDASGVTVRDLGSRNGFFVNGRHIKSGESTPLADGDELILGRTGLRFYAEDPGDIEALPAPEVPEAIQPPAPSKPKGEGSKDLDEDLLKFARAAPEDEAAPPAARFTELSEELDEDTAIATAEAEAAMSRKKGSARARARKGGSSASLDQVHEGEESAKRGGSKRAGKASSRKRDASGRSRQAQTKAASARSEAAAAEVHSLRTMLDRSERERGFYRKLTVGLVAFMGLLVLVLAYKLISRGEAPPDKLPKETGPKLPDDLTRPPSMPIPVRVSDEEITERMARLDKATFQEKILPWLEQACASCHVRGGEAKTFHLNLNDPEQSFAEAARFVVPDYPDKSPLLLEPLDVADNGSDHGGGTLISTESEMFRVLRDWIGGSARMDAGPAETPVEAPKEDLNPVARIQVASKEVAVGDEVNLDGSGSESKTNSTLLASWTMVTYPEGSNARLDDDGALITSFIPDVAGTYVLQLFVQDGSYTGRASVTIVASGEMPSSGSGGMKQPDDEPEDEGPEGPSKEEVAPIFRACTGRDMTDEDYKEVLKSSKRRTAREILGRIEAKVYLLERELPTFGLEGANAPPSFYLKTIAKQFERMDNFTVRDAMVEFAISPYFNNIHRDDKAYAKGLVEAFLGRAPSGTESSAIRKMWGGKEATLLGEKGRGQAEAAAILARQEEFTRAFITRAYKLYTGADIDAATLDAEVGEFNSEPDRFFRRVERWVSGG